MSKQDHAEKIKKCIKNAHKTLHLFKEENHNLRKENYEYKKINELDGEYIEKLHNEIDTLQLQVGGTSELLTEAGEGFTDFLKYYGRQLSDAEKSEIDKEVSKKLIKRRF